MQTQPYIRAKRWQNLGELGMTKITLQKSGSSKILAKYKKHPSMNFQEKNLAELSGLDIPLMRLIFSSKYPC